MRLKVRNYQIRTMTRESGRLQALFFEHALQPHIYLAIAGHTDEIEDHLYFTPLTFVFASEQRTDVYKMIEDVEMSRNITLTFIEERTLYKGEGN